MTEQLERERFSAARYRAATRHPYLAHALFAMQVIEAPGLETLAVDDAWRVYVDPVVVGRWSVEELSGVLLHEVHHLLREHAARATALGVPSDARMLFNIAGDAEINDDLLSEDVPLPGDPITPESLGMPAGLLAEQYYAAIRERVDGAPSCGSAAHGVPESWERDGAAGVSSTEADLIRRQVAEEIRAAAPGTVPEGLRRWADAIAEAKVDWRRELAAAIRRAVAIVAGRSDYSYRRPSRRHPTRAIVFPSLVNRIPNVAVVVDTSASMSDAELGDCLAEIDAIIKHTTAGRVRVRVLAADTEVHEVTSVARAKDARLVGGGGTNMARAVEAANELRPPPDVVVVLTDGLTDWPTRNPGRARAVVAITDAHGSAPAWARSVLLAQSGTRRREAPK